MAVPRLHPDTIEAVKQQADIVDVVSEHVVLKKQGKDLVGLCPFHDDKSPSFSVSPSKQFYYCFSCGAGGNAIKFLMELNKSSFSDVVLDLARRYQVPVQTLEPEKRQELQRRLSEREQLYEITTIAAHFFSHALRQPSGARAMRYLTEARSLDPATIQSFQLGYAPGGWDTLYGYLVQQKQFPADLVEKAGLIVPRKSGDGYYDRFRDRLMIPILDPQGRVIGFGGRSLGDEQPKYLNSPETELFDKGKTLFGLDRAREAIAKQDRAIVVEGYFDVIALHAAGIPNAVAALGTALSLGQVKQLLRYTESKCIVLNFDADGAGQKATQRAIGEVENLAYRGEVQLRVLNLPGGKDADEFLRSYSPTDYGQLLDAAPLWLDWQLERAIAERNLAQADQFQAAVTAVVQLLSNIPNAALRTHYIRQCAERIGRDRRDGHFALQLEQDLRTQVQGQRWHGKSDKWLRPADFSLREAAEADLLRIYLHCPDLRRTVLAVMEEREIEFSLSHHRLLWRTVLQLQEQAHDRAGTDLEAVELPIAIQSLPELSAEALQPLDRLLNLDELGHANLARPELSIRAAVASLESLTCEKRCRHLLDTFVTHYLQYEVLIEQSRRAGRLDRLWAGPIPLHPRTDGEWADREWADAAPDAPEGRATPGDSHRQPPPPEPTSPPRNGSADQKVQDRWAVIAAEDDDSDAGSYRDYSNTEASLEDWERYREQQRRKTEGQSRAAAAGVDTPETHASETHASETHAGETHAGENRVIDLNARRQQRQAADPPAELPTPPPTDAPTHGSLALDPLTHPTPSANLATDPALQAELDRAFRQQQHYQDLFFQERQYLQQLRQERHTSFNDLTRSPLRDGF